VGLCKRRIGATKKKKKREERDEEEEQLEKVSLV
jgi:hypothetical protein